MRALAFSGGKDSMACLHMLKDTIECAIYVNTGYVLPETLKMIEYAKDLVPVHIMYSKRKEQNEREGIPADVVPINWTILGQSQTGPKPIRIQSYLQCCFENIAFPLIWMAKQLGVTELVYGQRDVDSHKSMAKNGDMVDGIKRLHPIEDWSEYQVMEYLQQKMVVPAHYHLVRHSSLDCYDCTAFKQETGDKIRWMEKKHPELYKTYEIRATLLNAALKEALA